MTMLKEILAELVGMFVGDAWLTAAILALVAVAAGLIRFVGVAPLTGGLVLLLGCLALLAGSVLRHRREARRG
jgi:hypothetical protein